MFEEIDVLDYLGLYKEADELQKLIIAQNNFNLTQKRFDPRKRMQNKLDMINNQLNSVMDSLDNSDSGGGEESSITVQPIKENDIEKVKFDIEQ